MHEFTKKTIDQRYAAKNAELFIKQNFQELIGMTDRKFIEHVRYLLITESSRSKGKR